MNPVKGYYDDSIKNETIETIRAMKGKVELMKKRIGVIALAAALAASQAIYASASQSPGTNPVIGGSSSDGGSYDIGERVDSAKRAAAAGTAASSGQGDSQVQIGAGQTTGGTAVTINSRGQAVIGDTALEFVQGSGSVVSGLPERVVETINGINSGQPLGEVVPDVDLTGYNALVGTHAIVTKEAVSNVEKTGQVEVPLYVPNLMDGLGDVEVLFYDNMTGTWKLIKPTRVDAGSKMMWFNIPNSGTFSVIYKR